MSPRRRGAWFRRGAAYDVIRLRCVASLATAALWRSFSRPVPTAPYGDNPVIDVLVRLPQRIEVIRQRTPSSLDGSSVDCGPTFDEKVGVKV